MVAEIVDVIMAGNDGLRAYIYLTAVYPDYLKQGISSLLLDNAMAELSALGINKIALVIFCKNELGNCFGKSQGFLVRDDLVYRDKALKDIVRIDT